MKERPILFTGAMVRALLAGTKTQTRRPLYVATKNVEKACFDNRYRPTYGNGEWPNLPVGSAWTLSQWRKAQPGDLLWVRESHWWFKDEPDHETGYYPPPLDIEDVEYRADGDDGRKVWRPSIHMPRWASRITLEVTGVRVERLQDISEADAKAEGCDPLQVEPHWPPADLAYFPLAEPENPYRSGYASLWEAINGHGTWAENPWVLAITFKTLETT